LLWWKHQHQSFCKNLDCILLDGKAKFTLSEVYTDTPSTFRALFYDNERYLRIEAKEVAAEFARQELHAEVVKVKAMFEKAPAPYPGDVSDAIVCDPKFVPTYEEIPTDGIPLSLFVGYLNDRMTFGSCSQDQTVYRGILILTYCPRESLLLRAELITTPTDFSSHEQELMDHMKALRCKP
jgi:hypothetical protein